MSNSVLSSAEQIKTIQIKNFQLQQVQVSTSKGTQEIPVPRSWIDHRTPTTPMTPYVSSTLSGDLIYQDRLQFGCVFTRKTGLGHSRGANYPPSLGVTKQKFNDMHLQNNFYLRSAVLASLADNSETPKLVINESLEDRLDQKL
jgi:hypothetical protein